MEKEEIDCESIFTTHISMELFRNHHLNFELSMADKQKQIDNLKATELKRKKEIKNCQRKLTRQGLELAEVKLSKGAAEEKVSDGWSHSTNTHTKHTHRP